MLGNGKGDSLHQEGWDRWAIAVWAMIIVYVAFFAPFALQKHNAFQTTAFDLGNVDQTVWNTRHGRPFAMTNIEGLTNRLGTHVEPILLPVSLLYILWSDPRTLLLLQTALIALGAWPVYLLARHALPTTPPLPHSAHPLSHFALRVLPLLFALVYLLFPALQSANVFDFHAVALAPAFFLFAFYCLETGRWGGYALFCLLTMSCKEDMPLLVVMLGLYAWLVRRNWRVGLATILIALAWFVLAVGVVMPAFDPIGVSPLANRYAYLGDDPLQIATSLLLHPSLALEHLLTTENLVYLLNLLAPVAFLSLVAPQVLVMALPTLLTNLLSTDGFMHQLEGFHYGVTLVPIVVVSGAYGAAWLIRHLPRLQPLPVVLAAGVLVAALGYHRGHGYTPLAAAFPGNWPTVDDHDRLGESLASSIPAHASLAALPHPNPHASQRQQLVMIDRVENGLPAPLHDADYVWLDATNGWPLHPNDLKAGAEALLAGEYGVDQAADGWLLLRRGAPEKVVPDSFYDFARTTNPQPQYPLRLQFLLDGQPVLECLGFDLVLDRPLSSPETLITTTRFYWRALRPLPPDLRLYPFYFDDSTGQVLEDTTLRPMIATVWLTPDRWQPGEVLVTSMLPWEVGGDFAVGLGVVQGTDWNQVNQRLPIRVESSETVVRLFDGDTWTRLIRVEDGEPVPEYRSFALPSAQHPLDVDLGGQIRLLGYDLAQDSPATTHLTLYWQAQHRLDTSYTVFAQLLDPAGNLRTQVDSVPQGGGYPTTWWLPGEVVADRLTLELPADAPLDVPYRLIVGLYDPVTGARLPVSGTDADYVELAEATP